MTLQELLDYLSGSPKLVLGYFLFIPLLALIAGVLDKDQGHYQPWNYIYAVLIYAVCIPGIFVITLNIYLFLFERRDILSMDLLTQIVPMASMVVTIWIIRRNVILDYIPGFDRLSGLIMIIAGVISLMWIIDRVRIVAFTQIRFQYVLLFLVGMLVLIRLGLSRLSGPRK